MSLRDGKESISNTSILIVEPLAENNVISRIKSHLNQTEK
jgi:hypothetical protein